MSNSYFVTVFSGGSDILAEILQYITQMFKPFEADTHCAHYTGCLDNLKEKLVKNTHKRDAGGQQ